MTTARDQATARPRHPGALPALLQIFLDPHASPSAASASAITTGCSASVEGVDGIKTGYIRASGFNLVTSVKRKSRHVVAVVLGGTSAGARDARMRAAAGAACRQRLHPQDRTDDRRSAGARHARAARSTQHGAAETGGANRFEMASAADAGARRAARLRPAAGSDEPIRPVAVRTVSVKPPAVKGAKTAPSRTPRRPHRADRGRRTPAAPQPEPAGVPRRRPRRAHPRRSPRRPRAGVLRRAAGPGPRRLRQRSAAPAPCPGTRAGPRSRRSARRRSACRAAGPGCVPSSRPQTRSGWVIQVGAYPAESRSQAAASVVKTKASRLLAAAEPLHRDGAARRNHPLPGPFCRARARTG